MTSDVRLLELESLVTRSEGGEYLETELDPLLRIVMQREATPENHALCTRIFTRIAALDKSTFFGCNFYRELQEANPGFAQQVLERAIYIEPYYNCNASALAAYCLTVLKNNTVPLPHRLFNWIIEHGLYPQEDVHVSKAALNDIDYAGMQKAVVHSIDVNTSYFLFNAGLRVVKLLDMVEVEPVLANAVRRRALSWCEDRGSDRRFDYVPAKMLSHLADAIHHITGSESYGEIAQIMRTEGSALAQVGTQGERQVYAAHERGHNRIIELIRRL